LNELEKNDDIILFIDEIHTIVGAGGATGSLDASTYVQTHFSQRRNTMYWTTTLDEYRQYREKMEH
jgi:ATP-dependent Clp protease ATP-binding subunit ClpC